MQRQTALAAGLTFYDTGKPCRNGHSGPRYAKTGHCVACLKDARDKFARLQNTGMAARSEGSGLFAYKLHPDDHAAALAYCQGLDLQRGRVPQSVAALAAPSDPQGEADAIAREIARRREELTGKPRAVADHVPAEFAKVAP